VLALAASSGSGLVCSVACGFFAASAGVLTKVAFDSNKVQQSCQFIANVAAAATDKISHDDDVFFLVDCTNRQVELVAQVVLVSLLVLCNLLMFKYFNAALQLADTTIVASITCTASNFIFTALYGWWLFEENLNTSWWIGTSLVILGAFLIASDNDDDRKKKKKEGDKREKTD